ncbi:MAG TPA: hypothetical protein VKB57_03025, partial [Acidimicrobiales bacterium]|nr:hypothetical protein [Acidimicrobiales bacterium]
PTPAPTPQPTQPPTTRDRTGPNITIGGVSVVRVGLNGADITVSVSANDPQSGVRSLHVTINYQYFCEGDQGGQEDPGPQVFDRNGSSGTFTAGIGCSIANRKPGNIRGSVVVVATNNIGLTSSKSTSY